MILFGAVTTISSLLATDYTWQAATGGDFGVSSNWNPTGVPGSADTAFFNSGTGTVNANSLSSSTTVSRWLINSGLTFDFGGKTLIADSTSGTASTPDMSVTATSATLTNGSYSAVVAQVGSASGSTLNVSGAGTSFTVGGGFYQTGIAVNSNTSGTITVSNSAQMTINSLEFDLGGGSNVDNVNALLHITGSGATVSINSLIVAVGSYFNNSDNNVATLRVSSGASVTASASTTLYVGQSDRGGSSGTVVVESGGTFNTSGSIQVGRTDDSSNSATLAVQTGGAYKGNSGAIQIYGNATVYVGASSLLEAGVIQNNSNNGPNGMNATVMGSGTIRSTAATFNQYGVLQPGDTLSGAGVGTLAIGDGTQSTDMTLNAFSTMFFGFDGTGTSQYDRLLVTGAINGTSSSGGTLVLTFNFTPSASDTFTIMNATSGWSGLTASGFNIIWDGFATGGSVNLVGNNLVVSNVTAAPEPSSLLLLLGGGLLLAIQIKRSKRGRVT